MIHTDTQMSAELEFYSIDIRESDHTYFDIKEEGHHVCKASTESGFVQPR